MIKNKTLVEKGILCILAVFFFAIYVSLSFSKNIWTDEAFTIDLIKRSIPGIVRGTAIDVHPPLYYLIAKIPESICGSSLLALKFVSIMPIVLLMTVGAFKIYEMFSFQAAALFIVFLGIIPCTTEYAVQLRMYSWAIFFVTWMGLLSYCFYKDNKIRDIVLVALVGAGAAYTHYFAFVSALWVYGFLFLAIVIFNRTRIKGWLIAVVISGLLYAPWLKVLSQQVGSVSESYWIEKITGKTILGFLPFLFDNGTPVSTVIWVGILIISLFFLTICICKKDRVIEAVFAVMCLLVPICTTITGVVVSNILRPIFIIRYVIPCIGLIALFLAIAVDRLLETVNSKRLVRWMVFGAAVLFFIVSVGINYKNAYRLEYTWCKTYDTLNFFDENFKPGDKIVYNYTPYDFVYQCYWDESTLVAIEDLQFDGDMSDATYWLLDTVYWPKPTALELEAGGYTLEYMGNYGIEHNDFKIYKISKS